MHPREILRQAAAARPAAPAVRCGALTLTYPQLLDLSRALASSFGRAGGAAGDRVAALFPNCHLYLAAYWAALEAGMVLVPLNTRLAPPEWQAVLAHSGARLLIGEPDRVGPLAAGPPAAEGEGWALVRTGAAADGSAAAGAAHLYYTSGTTGSPKGVILTRGNLLAHVDLTLAEIGFTADDVWLHAAPMFHLADAWAIWTVTAAGGVHVMLPRFEAAAAFDLIDGAGVTLTNLVPVMLAALVDEAAARGRRLPSLRLLLSGGAPIAPEAAARVGAVLGCEYAQTYGLTETSPFLTFSLLDAGLRRLPPAEQARLRARTGRPARGVELRVARLVDGGLVDVAPDDASVGEVLARGATVTPGYWRDPAATAAAFHDGWFRTGDLATIDVHGFLNLVDRAKDVIVTGGETVYSTEVEHALGAHPAVREAAVFAVPDDRWGEAVRAAVALRAGAEAGAEALAEFCRARIAAFKCPRAIDFVGALPRTGSGKVDKKALREPFWRGRPRRIN